MGRHSDPDPRAFYRSLGMAALRATMVLAAVGALTAVVAFVAQDREDRSPVIAFPGEESLLPGETSPGYDVSQEPSAGGDGGAGAGTDMTTSDAGAPDASGATGSDAGASQGVEPEDGAGSQAASSSGAATPSQSRVTPPHPSSTGSQPPSGASASSGTASRTDSSGATGPTPGRDARVDDVDRPARAPEDTSVQVLDGGGGPEATQAAVDMLRERGYLVIAVNRSRPYDVTTVLWSPGYRTEAQALLESAEEVHDIGRNPNLSEQVHLHLVVGTDWDA
jgi:hypothetical protein